MPLLGQHSLAEARDLDAATADDMRAFDALFGNVSVPWVNGDSDGFVNFSDRQEVLHKQWELARAPLTSTLTSLESLTPGGDLNAEDAYQALVATRRQLIALRGELEAAANRYNVPIPAYTVAQPTAPDRDMQALMGSGAAIDAGASAARGAASSVASTAADALKSSGLADVPWVKLGLLVGAGLLVTAALQGVLRR